MTKFEVYDKRIQIQGKILKVPKQMIGEVSKLLKDQFGIILTEKKDSYQNQYKIKQKKQIAQIASPLINYFRNYCKDNQYTIVENELSDLLEKKGVRKVFTLQDLYELQFKNKNRKEFLDKWEPFLSLGHVEQYLMNNKKIKSEIKLELKAIISLLIFECQKEDPKESMYKSFQIKI
ncbi:unnamed protein product [Paramecium sonneborni]|uniref:Uncharacterized protein n=1 Tax=Paramecium sonneborni TaxID=65129 RepID=A0A8S1LGI4_9CILI|nr:unnamed protein product [Paramecium sonneborni]